MSDEVDDTAGGQTGYQAAQLAQQLHAAAVTAVQYHWHGRIAGAAIGRAVILRGGVLPLVLHGVACFVVPGRSGSG